MTSLALKQPAEAVVSDEAAQATALSARLADQPTVEILREVITNTFKGRIALVSSFGAESVVLLHLAAQVDKSVPILFIDTGQHFAQTLSFRRRVARQLGLTNVIDLFPDKDELSSEDPTNTLWQSNPDACCTLRKVRPLTTSLESYDAWITGRKQFHGGARLQMPIVEHSGAHFKVNPLARWQPDAIAQYAKQHDLPNHPLVDHGFPSIGCWPCTHPVAKDDDVRSGRWRGQAKTECGIHTKLG